MHIFRYIFLIPAIFSATTAISEDLISIGAINEAQALMLMQHPSVQMYEEQAEMHLALSKKALSLPDPELIVGIDNIPFNDPGFDRFLPSSKVFGIRQGIPNPGSRKASADIASMDAKLSRLLKAYQIEKLKGEFIQELNRLWSTNALQALTAKHLQLLDQMESDYRGQLSSGRPVYAELSVVDLKRANLQLELNNLESEQTAIEERLTQLYGQVPEPKYVQLALKEWRYGAAQIFPVNEARLAMERARSQVTHANEAFKPNYSIQALYKQRDGNNNFSGDDWFSLQASISVPVWSSNLQEPNLEAAHRHLASLREGLENTQRLWVATLLGLQAKYKGAEKNITALATKQAASQRQISAALRQYESGYAKLSNVLEARINRYEIEARVIQEKTRLNEIAATFNSHIEAQTCPSTVDQC